MFQDEGIYLNDLLFKMTKTILCHHSCSFCLIRLLIWASQQAFNRESKNHEVFPQPLDAAKSSAKVTEAVKIYTS